MTTYDWIIIVSPILLITPIVLIIVAMTHFGITQSHETRIKDYLKKHYPNAVVITKQSGNDIEQVYFVIQNDDKGYQATINTSNRKELTHKERQLSIETMRSIRNAYFRNTIKA